VVTALADRSTLVVSDAHIHASLVDAVRLSRARLVISPHNDVAAVEAALAAAPGERALVLAESVYSVLSDAAPLVELAGVCARYDALLVVDEAHGLGVHGPGLVANAGLAGQPHVVVTATLSKSLGSQGGAVLGSPALLEHLVNRARPFIFDTGLAPAAAGAALAALGVLRAEPERPAAVRERAARLAEIVRGLGLPTPEPAAAVVPAVLGDPRRAVAAAADCLASGVRVGCFRPPAVPPGRSCLRLTARATLTDADLDRAAAALRAALHRVVS
jgi:8-amino-7-oxononanoate synthase